MNYLDWAVLFGTIVFIVPIRRLEDKGQSELLKDI